MILSKIAERPVLTTGIAIFGPLFLAAVLVKYGLTFAVAPVVLPLAVWLLVERRGLGLFIAIA
ncbi:MAG: hypothetical protein QOI19_2030, partial [Thermoleophilaceae bacterium]|nr:hypothetical protein [Thermoleophilaceae bacterium]